MKLRAKIPNQFATESARKGITEKYCFFFLFIQIKIESNSTVGVCKTIYVKRTPNLHVQHEISDSVPSNIMYENHNSIFMNIVSVKGIHF